MKKKLIFTFLLFFMLIPLNIHAASITKADVSGTNSGTVGSRFNLSFNVSYSGVEKGSTDTLGVAGVVLELYFDDSVFSIVGVSGSDFNTKVLKNDDKYYVESSIGDNVSSKNKCVDEFLICSDYQITVTFYLKDTDKTSSNIKLGETAVVLFKVNSGYLESDSLIITSTPNKSHAINITKTNMENMKEPQSIASNSKPTNIIPKSVPKVTTTSKANPNDSNAYLRSLGIKGHQIAFDKEKLEYKIHLDKKENALDVDAKTESESATVKIIGAEDLKGNDYKVLIEVTAKDGTKKAYVVNASNKTVINQENVGKKPKLNKKTISIITISVGVIFVIVMVVFIILHFKNRKINKMLDDFEKF